MKSKSALFNLFLGVFALSLPGMSLVSQFANVLLAAYAGVFAVTFVYDNLPKSEYEKLSFFEAKALAAGALIFGSPVFLYAYLWTVLAPVGFNQILVLLVLVALFYIPLVIVAWIIFWVAITLLGID